MLRRSLLLLPLLAALAALVGSALAQPVVAVLLAAAGGAALAAVLARLEAARTGEVADRVARFAEGEPLVGPVLAPTGSREWQRLLEALRALGSSLQARFAELAGERARIERLLDDLPTAILLFTGRELAYANPAAEALFRIDPTQEARTPLQILGVEGLVDALTEARETGRTVQVEVQRAERELVARASVTAEGEVALVITDLTDSKRIEEIRRDFVTNASHELKTPVAGIQALSESLGLAIDRDPDRARKMIHRLQLEAERLAHLVRELLDLARLEEAGARGRHPVDVAQLVRVHVHRLGRLAEERQVSVRADCPAPASVISMPEDLRLIVVNLLENAVQYNRPGGTVTATVRREGSQVVFEVADTGLGIPEAEQDRVFERFYRVDKARSRQAGGTGLGLSIVRHAAQRHGGEVTVRSILGEGSTFRVVLPVEGERAGRA